MDEAMTKFCQIFLFSDFLGVSTCFLLPSNFGSLVLKFSLKIISEVRNSTIYIDYLQTKRTRKEMFYEKENKRSSKYEERELLEAERLETVKLCLSCVCYPR